MKIIVDRLQYGIGQGCFHTQRIAFQAANEQTGEYRFVYDCGSKTKAILDQPSPLNWAIWHHTGRREIPEGNPRDLLQINTFFVTHFHFDHISGMAELNARSEIAEIVIPYLDYRHLASLLAQQIANGEISDDTENIDEYLDILITAASAEGNILGIPTTRIINGGQAPDNPPAPPDWNLEENGDITIGTVPGTRGRWMQNTARILQLSNANRSIDFWLLKPWTYQQSEKVTKAVLDELTALSIANGDALENLLRGIVDQKELRWMIQNGGAIQAAYKKALLTQGIALTDHNTLSLCLYSGPIHATNSLFWRSNLGNYPWFTEYTCRYNRRNNHDLTFHGWLATGDANLADPLRWADFVTGFQYYGASLIDRSRSILMPHHGSRNGAYNDGLLRGENRIAAFSAGALNQWCHPNREVLEAVSARQCYPVTITELTRPGFHESLTYNYSNT